MITLETLQAFHFLRPLWLLALPMIGLTWWLVRGREARGAAAGAMLAPHLRDALTMNSSDARRLQAVDGVAVAMLFTALSAAGPAWNRQVSPWFEETAPLVVALEVSDSMRSNDLLPTRLDRARFKVLDLVRARTGARTALIAYAGTAHVVMPPTTDSLVLKRFLESLDPIIMPTAGSSAASVLPLAGELLGSDRSISTLLFVNDGFEAADLGALQAFAAEPGAPGMAALIVGTDEGGVALRPDGSVVTSAAGTPLDTRIDESMLNRAEGSGIRVIRMETGDADLYTLARIIESNLRQADDPEAIWRDQGWWLLWPAMLLTLAWFRRGWTMTW